MKVNFSISLITISFIALSGMVQKINAQSAWCPNCWYVGSYAGPAWLREMDITFEDPTGVNPSQPIITDYRIGAGFGTSVGAVFCQNWRLEIEGYFRSFRGKRAIVALNRTVACVESCFTPSCPVGSTVQPSYTPSTYYRAFSLMLNGFYDFCICPSTAWYVGGGVGPSWINYKVDPTGSIFTFHGKTRSVRFSYQILTGITYRLSNHVSATIGYRLWGTLKHEHGSGTYTLPIDLGGASSSYNIKEKRILLVNSAELGLRFCF